MEIYRRKIFFITLCLILLTSVIPDVKGFFHNGGFILNFVPLLLDIIIISMIIFKFKWMIHAVIIWSAWQILVTLLLLFGIIFIMVASESSRFPITWFVLQIIFGLIKIIGIVYLLNVIRKLNSHNTNITS